MRLALFTALPISLPTNVNLIHATRLSTVSAHPQVRHMLYDVLCDTTADIQPSRPTVFCSAGSLSLGMHAEQALSCLIPHYVEADATKVART